MAGLIYYTEKRRVLPQLERVATYKDTVALPPLADLSKLNWMQPIIQLKDGSLHDELSEWRKSKNYNLAGNILSQAILLNRTDEFDEVSAYLLGKYPGDNIYKWLFRKGLAELSTEQRIKHNHEKLALEPEDAITWADQAINYMLLNAREDAIKSIESAISIERSMGYIVRSASRIFNLIGDNGRAIKLLKDSEYYRHDPQILSAEIALSQLENRKTTGIAIGDKLINDNQYNHHEKSELASTLGTIEFFKENFKRSEQLFDLSLVDSNKNSFEQSLWYKRKEISPQQYRAYSDSNEIQTHRYSKDNDFEKALFHSLRWIAEEPYSARPYRVSSYIKGVIFGNHSEAFDLIKRGTESQKLIKGDNFSHHEEIGFNNDMAYHLLKANRIQEAESYLEPILKLKDSSKKLGDIEYVGIATLGLYAYKMNELDLGKKMYRKTITHFVNAGNEYLAGSAFLNFFDEEVKVSNSIENLVKLRTELDEVIPDDATKNELILRKSSSLKLFDQAVLKLKQERNV
jgi:tetratricopeptide (TPR) repeat protein